MADALESYVKRAYRQIVGARCYELIEFRRHLGYWPNLEHPRTFNEKVCARKFRPFPEAGILADKLAVREFVTKRAGHQFLTHLFYSGTSLEAVDYDALPDRFVLKGNHSSGQAGYLLVRDKAALPREAFVAAGRRILRRRFGPEVNEWWYAKIVPQLLVEEMLLEDDGSLPTDLKFYVFGGVVHYVQIISGRDGTAKSRFYDRFWRPQPFTRRGFDGPVDMPRPGTLDDMVTLAEILGDGLEFVRVDLYSIGPRILFGEMTLAPGAGWIAFDPPEYDLILGERWPVRVLPVSERCA
ncbi:MAG TPA: ATP-grasp fold amidoligase family protein [bacterium]|nr:ATP-grasp fold amidoligase family protein [bacterium]